MLRKNGATVQIPPTTVGSTNHMYAPRVTLGLSKPYATNKAELQSVDSLKVGLFWCKSHVWLCCAQLMMGKHDHGDKT
ncbi:hypothetical protein AVEN_172871-1 [Araneus ventricosus]|uniref:Uncharacterized protein n=1 Tax=Araneus ventricosus TaxID=182803 RepID=A0A4Y2TJ02_ARAVE|nr:hypothetical protein AVEN_267205-1 [Araneus ventricosus]GBN99430.1 hypothetical protein AVEN_90088-1 [Araneus ventricosus]GBN99437.1 hypothetical protein AVEN_269232-1 [Araneus ventricosus]GBN99440.1 hypothetical protein AVEN_172871-1 [Araneus ventricosus]